MSSKVRPQVVERIPAYLPYVRGITDRIGHLLRRRCSIRTIFRPMTQIKNILRSPKDRDPLDSPGVYEIPCDCGENYIGETGRNIKTRLSEHIRSIRKLDSNTSAVAEHALVSDMKHYIRFDKVKVLAREKNFVSRKLREAIEISRRPNYNRDKGWVLPPAWDPVLLTAKRNNIDSVEDNLVDIVSVFCAPVNNNTINSSVSSSSPPTHSVPPAPPAPPVLTNRALRARARSDRRDAIANKAGIHSP
ncbi:PREDICTED: uncharacterized protein LOC106106200 [Papilio polytes]|uniref:uncharacterized protein LOC106106200 n=1 Tax=Papilio polytes TaxID=76194 RepID=UPI000676864B|nr:PREDICTED: uncharacterized protein LOC106106200 [Papilio polytes]